MFEIHNTQATIRSINPRAENHGDEHALACDISLEFTVSNKKLNLLDPGLLACLYTSDGEGSSQQPLDFEADLLPHRRFPLFGKIPWAYEGVGYKFQLINDGLHGEEVIEVADCKLNKIEIECEEGGTIKLRARVQGNPSEETIGDLCGYIKEEVRVSLLPPEKPAQEEMEMVDEDGEAA